MIAPVPLPAHLAFLEHPDLLAVACNPEWWRGYDCLCVLDCGEASRLDDIIRPAAAMLPTCTIDHHASSTGVGEVCWIEPGASSVGEMVVALARHAGWNLPPFAAKALWTAIVTDTGRFSYENTTAAALDAARECVQSGAEPSMVAAHLYQSITVVERRLQTLVLERMELSEKGRLAISWLVRDDYERIGCGLEETQNLINLLRDTAGVDVAIFLYEPPTASHPQEVKVSFRTNSPFDALQVTTRFNGGGHKRAAGCSLRLPMEEARRIVLDAARQEFFTNRG